MNLESRLAKGILITGIGLVSLAINPNYESTDFKEPHRYVQKFDHRRGYDASGKVYTGSAAVFFAGLVGTAYALMKGKE